MCRSSSGCRGKLTTSRDLFQGCQAGSVSNMGSIEKEHVWWLAANPDPTRKAEHGISKTGLFWALNWIKMSFPDKGRPCLVFSDNQVGSVNKHARTVHKAPHSLLQQAETGEQSRTTTFMAIKVVGMAVEEAKKSSICHFNSTDVHILSVIKELVESPVVNNQQNAG